MKRTEYMIPQIHVVTLRQQPLMQIASQQPRVKEDEESDPTWQENGEWNL